MKEQARDHLSSYRLQVCAVAAAALSTSAALYVRGAGALTREGPASAPEGSAVPNFVHRDLFTETYAFGRPSIASAHAFPLSGMLLSSLEDQET